MGKNLGKILVTGGSGYIGGHTIVDLVEHGFEVVSIDNFSKGYPQMLTGIQEIIGKEIKNYAVDICDYDAVNHIIESESPIQGIIHFAAYKSVPESVAEPLKYFENNIQGLINMLKIATTYDIPHFVFSSSCSVYGNADTLPVTEQTPLKPAESPYARTKAIGEEICRDIAIAHPALSITLLRYFNPVGAHPSIKIGELNPIPENLVPIITQTAAGIRTEMGVFGHDYDTRDGTCIRDYIHVSDIAHAHTQALLKSIDTPSNEVKLYNLGTGNGVSILELIQAFEKVSGVQLNYSFQDRRPGDVIQVYADRTKATSELAWEPKFDIEQMMKTAWEWQLALINKQT